MADKLFATYIAMNKPAPPPAALAVMAEDLAGELTDEQLLRGLKRTRLEREWISVKAIIELSGASADDGRPEVEAAWAMCPRSEEKSTVWTSEMAEAFDLCRGLLNAGEEIAARMVFKEHYSQILSRARVEHAPVRWTVSLGWDANDRVRALAEAIEHKRITERQAYDLLGFTQREELLARLPPATQRMLTGEVAPTNTAFLSDFQRMVLLLREAQAIPETPQAFERKELSDEELRQRKQACKAQAAALLAARPAAAGEPQ